MSLELGCASILGVIILAAIVLCIWVVPSRKVAPPKPSPVIVTKYDYSSHNSCSGHSSSSSDSSSSSSSSSSYGD